MSTALPVLAAAGICSAAAAAFAWTAWKGRGPRDSPPLAAIRRLNEIYLHLVHRLHVTPGPPGVPVPLQGPAIIVANHRSGVDPQAIQAGTKRIIHWLMAREYYERRAMNWFFRLLGAIAVNRDGKDLGATKAALRTLKEGHVVGLFPEGGIQLEGTEGEAACRGPWGTLKSGAALLALHSGAPVIPVHVRGTPNLDSVFLALLRPSRSTVAFGEPLRLEPRKGKPTREEIDAAARRIADEIARLGAL